MKCSRCQQENPAHARFCLGCGARLALACSTCGTELPGGARFCLQCGQAVAAGGAAASPSLAPEAYTPKHLAEKILTSKAALEGERKQVTVLFADLKGSMELLADRDPEEARKILDPVLERMMETLAAAIDIRFLMRSVLLQLGQFERAAGYLKETEVLALTLGDRQRLAWVWAYTTTALLFAGEPVRAMAVGEKARALADEVGDTGLRASARTPLAHACRERGDLRRSVTVFGEAIDLLTGELVYQRFGQAIPPAIYARCVAAVSLAELGEFGEAMRLATEAQALTQLKDLPFGFAVAHMVLGNIHLLRNRMADTLQVLESALAVIQARGILFPWATALHGYVLALSGHTGEGCAVLAGALEDAVKLRFLFAHSQWISWLAHAHLLAGRMDEAREHADEALRLSRQRGQRAYEALALYVRGEIESLHERDSAETFCRQGLVLADELGMRPLVAHCHLGLGKLYQRTGKREQAQEHLAARDDDVPRDGHDVLTGEGGGGDAGVGMTVQGAGLASSTPHRPSINRRRFLLTTLVGALAAPLAARAQHEGKMARVGFLAGARREMLPISVPTFVGQLRELGYIEGQNLVIEFRHADTQERFRELTTELAGVGVQVIYATNPYAVRGAREATMTLPIVGYDYESDPVAAGYAASLARPAGNVTGVFLDQAGVSAKQLQLLTELLPGISRVAVLWDALLATPQHEAVKDAARRLGVAISSIVWRGPDELPSALRAANRDGAQALIVLSTPRIHDRYRVFVAAAALKSRLPSIVLTSNFAQDGALMAYGPIQRDMHRIGATLVAKILRGAKPGDLPVERPTKFELAINLKTAKALGLTIPPSLLLRADQVID